MPKITSRFNSACEANIHTNYPQAFRWHVAKCEICQKKVPREILETLEPGLSQLITQINQAKEKTKVSTGPKKKEVKKEAVVSTQQAQKEQEMTDKDILDQTIKDLPSIQNLGKSVISLKQDVGRVANSIKEQSTLFTDELKALGESLQMAIQGKQGPQGQQVSAQEDKKTEVSPVSQSADTQGVKEGEKIGVSEEAKREAATIKEERGEGSSEPISLAKEEVKSAGEEETSSSLGLPPLNSPAEAATLEKFLSGEKKRMGITEEAGERPEKEPVKGGIPYIGEIAEGARGIRGIIDAIRGREGRPGPMTTGDMAGTIIEATVKSMLNKKDPAEYIVAGMKAQGESFNNAVSLFAKIMGKGPIGPSLDDMKRVAKEAVEESKGSGEHLTKEE